MDKEYTPAEAKAWLAGYDAGKAFVKKEWVGLTDEEIEESIDDGFAFGLDDGNVSNKYVIRYARTIEVKLKEKNT